MRSALVFFIAVVGCAAAVGASPKRVDSAPPMPAADRVVAVEQLINEFPDGAHAIGLYKAASTVRDVETANASVKAQVVKAQAIASDIGRVYAAAARSCEDVEVSQIAAIALRAKVFSDTLVRVDGELTKSLIAMRQRVEAERPTSIRAKEDVNRLSLAAHEIGRFRVQAQEIARTIEGLGVSLQKLGAACTPMQLPPLFAERAVTDATIPARRPNNTRPPPLPRRAMCIHSRCQTAQ
jgi:hypothetical protein